jgi:hypothetical protein
MKLAIVMIVSYIPFFYGMYKMYKEEQAEKNSHRPKSSSKNT